jgi:hypothetical protein
VAFGTGAVLAVLAAGLLLAGQQQRTPPPLR